MRGNRQFRFRFRFRLGSIPAYAGEPIGCILPRAKQRVYPRVCGGTGEPRRCRCGSPGLSPRMRGNHDILGSAPDNDRSIPAYAGEPPAAHPLLPGA